MGCQRIDKEAVFEELQHVKCEILEVQNRNEALWEENSLLEVCPRPSIETVGTCAVSAVQEHLRKGMH